MQTLALLVIGILGVLLARGRSNPLTTLVLGTSGLLLAVILGLLVGPHVPRENQSALLTVEWGLLGFAAACCGFFFRALGRRRPIANGGTGS